MTEAVYRAIADAEVGYVESPAGCGKTEAIVRAVGNYCSERQLILTHTHAGVDALRERFRRNQVPPSLYHVDTIAGWAWSWVRKYPVNANYQGEIDIPVWNNIYPAMTSLIEKDFVKKVILNSYTGVIVDEYQDCTQLMHRMLLQLKNILPCRILGDPLQGIFGFNQDPMVSWSDVERDFSNNLGSLNIPHRWVKVENRELGQWLLDQRPFFSRNQEPDFGRSPVERRDISQAHLNGQLIALTRQRQGSVCVIGAKHGNWNPAILTTLVNHNYRVLEPNELTSLQEIVVELSDGTTDQKADAALKFLCKAYSGFNSEKSFIERILKGRKQNPRRPDRQAMCQKNPNGISSPLLFDLLAFLEDEVQCSCKLRESVSALRCILEKNIETGAELKTLYAEEIAKRKYQSRSRMFRCFGSTLLLKGLEFDHAIILRGRDWQLSWGNHKDLYVALTRGAKSVTLLDVGN